MRHGDFLAGLAVAVLLPAMPASASELPTELRVLTYNVLADPVEPDARVAALSRIMQEANADIIALQEVTPWFTARLLREPWTEPYHRARQDGRTVIAHEFVILSRFRLLDFHTSPLPGAQRRVLHRITVDLAGTPTAIATCHLESLLDDGPTRATQLEAFFADLAVFEEAIFLGDFNFGDGEQPETVRLREEFVDAWRAVHPREPGFTWDVERSPFARRESFPGEGGRRLDRMLLKSTRWVPATATIVGDEPLAGSAGAMFPSDHFGLLVTLRRRP